jgi:hypothetical protein
LNLNQSAKGRGVVTKQSTEAVTKQSAKFRDLKQSVKGCDETIGQRP